MTDKEADDLIDQLEADAAGAYDSHPLAQPLREYVAELRGLADKTADACVFPMLGVLCCVGCGASGYPDRVLHSPECPAIKRRRQRGE
jgi:hypothetical protein